MVEGNTCTTHITIPPGAITAIGVITLTQTSPDSLLVVTGSATGQLATWQAHTVSTASRDRTPCLLHPVWVSRSHTGPVCGVVAGCFGSPVTVATAGSDSSVSVWELETGGLCGGLVGVIG